MSSCLSGGGRAYRLNLDLIKPPTTFSTSNSSSSSPSSTLSESSNSPPLSIFTRKPRTPRKRPNQTYNEAAAILSSAYPKLFPPKNLPKSFKLATSHGGGGGPFLPEPPDLLFADGGCLPVSPKAVERLCRSPGEVTSSPQGGSSEIFDDFVDDFDAESILDEEMEEGIDSIMGKLRVEGEIHRDSSNYCYGFPVGMGFDFRFGRMNELRAMRNVGEGDWWRSPSVNVVDVTPKIARIPAEMEMKAKTTRKKKTATPKTKSLASCSSSMASDELKKENLAPSEDSVPLPTQGLSLKLNYDDVLSAWSDKGSPFAGESPAARNDVQARLAHIDLFPARGAIVLCYKEKRRTLLFSRKIRYQVRKVNADQRPRIKGRFVRTPYSVEDD